MESDIKAAPATGLIRVEVQVKGENLTLWQAVEQGEVQGYFDADGAAFVLPEVYEMRVTDAQLVSQISASDNPH